MKKMIFLREIKVNVSFNEWYEGLQTAKHTVYEAINGSLGYCSPSRVTAARSFSTVGNSGSVQLTSDEVPDVFDWTGIGWGCGQGSMKIFYDLLWTVRRAICSRVLYCWNNMTGATCTSGRTIDGSNLFDVPLNCKHTVNVHKNYPLSEYDASPKH